jgi:hypothetical protein
MVRTKRVGEKGPVERKGKHSTGRGRDPGYENKFLVGFEHGCLDRRSSMFTDGFVVDVIGAQFEDTDPPM